MKIRSSITMLLYGLTLLLICPQAFAHNLWLNPGNYYPPVGTTVDIGIGWGHKYPADRTDQEFKEGRMEDIHAVDPDGLTVNLLQESVSLYKLKVEKAGAYIVTARIKPGFLTKTPDGRKMSDKKAVENPIKCMNYHIEAKTVIIAGGDDKNLGNPVNRPLELIPLKNPLNLKSGDGFALKVLYHGKPLPGLSVKATYAGFEGTDVGGHAQQEKGRPDKDVRKGPGQVSAEKGHVPVETVTDGQGQALVQLDKAGYWMIMLSHRHPYPDKEICDEYMFNTTFTFQVK